MPRAGVRRTSSVYVRIVRATFHGGPLVEFRGIEGCVGARAFDRAADEFVVLTRAFVRAAVVSEAGESNFAEVTAAVARSATAPTHIATRTRRLLGRTVPRITGNLPRSGVALWYPD